jgi:hypothetical protein
MDQKRRDQLHEKKPWSPIGRMRSKSGNGTLPLLIFSKAASQSGNAGSLDGGWKPLPL